MTEISFDVDSNDIVSNLSKSEKRELLNDIIDSEPDIYNEIVDSIVQESKDNEFTYSYLEEKLKDIFDRLRNSKETLDINQLEEIKQFLLKQNYI